MHETTADMLYTFLCRGESTDVPFLQRISHITSNYIKAGRSIDEIPVGDFFAPSQLDFTHGSYLCIDGTYYAYLLVPSDGYKSEVPAGWLSLLVNAGDGIDLDVFLTRQPKDRMIRKLGQQLRINRSKIKETSDTNTDFDDLDSAIRSGYFLKDGLSNHEDFYYLNLLITVTADNPDDLDWKCAEMKKLLISQDMDVQSCNFCQEQALRSSFPLVKLDKSLFERSKRNVLTLGAASCYPFTAYELCDDNGILLGVNKHNNSLIIVDIFDSRIYKNANIAILGTSGSGKTFTMQLMALRMRRKGIQVFIVAPLKGHEFHRACSNIGGAFIQISPASPNCINVMEIRQTDRSVDEQLDGSTVANPIGSIGQHLHAVMNVVLCRPQMRRNLQMVFDRMKIRINDFIITPIAAAQSMLTSEERRLGSVYVDHGAETTTVAVYKNNSLLYLNVLPMGSRNITRDLCSLNLLEEQADKIKRSYGDAMSVGVDLPNADISGASALDVSNYVSARAGEIMANVFNQLQFAQMTPGDLAAGFVTTGRGMHLKRMADLLNNISDMKVRTGLYPGVDEGKELSKIPQLLSVVEWISNQPQAANCMSIPAMPKYPDANEPAQPTHKPQATPDEQPKKPKKPGFFSRIIKQMSDGVEKTFEDAEDEQ